MSFIASIEDEPTEDRMLEMAKNRATFWIDVDIDVKSSQTNKKTMFII